MNYLPINKAIIKSIVGKSEQDFLKEYAQAQLDFLLSMRLINIKEGIILASFLGQQILDSDVEGETQDNSEEKFEINPLDHEQSK